MPNKNVLSLAFTSPMLALTIALHTITVSTIASANDARSFLTNPTKVQNSTSGRWELVRKRATYGPSGSNSERMRYCFDDWIRFGSNGYAEMHCTKDLTVKAAWSITEEMHGFYVVFDNTVSYVMHIRDGSPPMLQLKETVPGREDIKMYYIYEWRDNTATTEK